MNYRSSAGLRFPPRDCVTFRSFPEAVSVRFQDRISRRFVFRGKMLVFEHQQHRPKAREIERTQDFAVVSFRIDHEQIDSRNAMPL